MPEDPGRPPRPRVSVVIPTFDRAHVVVRAVRSVLEDTSPDLEVIVVDDGSTDDTARLLGTMDDRRLRVVHQENQGVSSARNRGIDESRGRLVTWLDSDDVAERGWAAFWLEAEAAGADLASCAIRFEDEHGQGAVYPPRADGPAFGNLEVRFLAGAMAVDGELLREVGAFRPGLAHSEHTELALRLGGVALERELTVITTDRALATTYRRSDPVDLLVLHDAAVAILTHEETHLTRSRHLRATYLAIAGTTASRLGRRREALRHLRRAVAANPAAVRNVARLVLAAVRPRPRRETSQIPDAKAH